MAQWKDVMAHVIVQVTSWRTSQTHNDSTKMTLQRDCHEPTSCAMTLQTWLYRMTFVMTPHKWLKNDVTEWHNDSVWRCVAVCCSVLQCVAVCCSVLQCVAVYCGVIHHDRKSSAPFCGKEPYETDYILQKRPVILRSLLTVATPYIQWVIGCRIIGLLCRISSLL